jgi:hypothetical protein
MLVATVTVKYYNIALTATINRNIPKYLHIRHLKLISATIMTLLPKLGSYTL